MGFPIGLMKDEKAFLEGMFNRIPQLRERFNRAVDTYPPERFEKIPEWLATVQRGLWAEMGIPDAKAGTLADHVAEMCRLAVLHTRDMELRHVMDLVMGSSYPKALSGDYMFSRYVSHADANFLHRLAARHVYDTRCHPYEELLDYMEHLDTPEARWVHDLDLLATYAKSRELESLKPKEVREIQQKIEKSLMTHEGKAVLATLRPAAAQPLPSPRR